MVVRRWVLLVSALAIGATGVLPAAPAAPANRPTPHVLGIGLQASTDHNGLGGWLPDSGVPWSYSYRYLGGGTANGSKNWTQWSPGATYPITYAKQASSHGYVPVFSYYQMLAGRACGGCAEAQKDLANLNNPTVMNAYFADFATLMQRLGNGTYGGIPGYGKDVIVHVEPDLSGYAQHAVLAPASSCFGHCTRAGNHASFLRASVRSSGFALAQRYPDTYRGFNSTLLALRDRYAPNVRLGFHISNWATGIDLNSSSDASLDARALGQMAGSFAAESGTRPTDRSHSTYDLVFNDVSNRDAGYYEQQMHKKRYWDQDNRAFPNFHRWEAYLKAATAAAGRGAFVWQVPMGNQLYRPQNNTAGHYQDNRVEYFLGHMAELRNAGVLAVLFGGTIAAASSYADAAEDGTTNPPLTCSSSGWSSGKLVCSSRTSTRADDDGGYLRMRAAQYYRAPLHLP